MGKNDRDTILEYTHEYEMDDRIMYFDVDYLTNEEGRLKIIEITLILLALLLCSEIRGVSGEKNLTMAISVGVILITFTIWIAKIFTLHKQLTPKHWFYMEALIYIFVVFALLVATSYMGFFGVIYWNQRNPEWSTLPSLVTGALLGAILIYSIDLIVLFRRKNNRTYIPDVSSYQL
ncbi:unnamed protein product [Bursaphelenchus xylophilus]|uniref:(pine wood nematode) hypothetical protein n=1 Tax=Bursaphelenchus xylophilus TaxID=6326 RepID=A0A1I7RL16_BURXY|nr:unnamed protein product [Bursaphelenchus xylophilus]CAG9083588.1 unnamed protein product [Bursaphelenchus xylophilus]